VKTSSSTLLSTTVPPADVTDGLQISPTRERENLVGAQIDVACSPHACDLSLGALPTNNQARAIFLELERDFAASMDAERLPDLQGDRDLSLLRDPHFG
jgi:hypothetical protein